MSLHGQVQADEEFPFTQTLAVPSDGATAVDMGPCPIRRCRGVMGALSHGKPQNRTKPGHFRNFRCKITTRRLLGKTLLHCKNTASGSRFAARKTTRWSAARANIPTILI